MSHRPSLESAKPSIALLGGLLLLGAVLALARSVLIPIALSILLTFILTPAVVALQRRGWSRTPAVLLVSFSALLCIAGSVVAISSELHHLASDLPAHKENILRRMRDIFGEGPGVWAGLAPMFDAVGDFFRARNPEQGFSVPVTISDEKRTGF